MLRWIIFIIFFVAITIYGFQAIKTVTKSTWVYYAFFIVGIIVAGNFLFQFLSASEGRVLSPAKSYAFGFLLTFIAFNLVLIPVLLGEDIIRLIFGLYDRFVVSKDTFYMPSRRKFISQIALGLAAIPLSSLLYGMYKGKYRFRVLNYTMYFEDLPEAFDGYKITQISDIHSGSFDNKEKIAYGVNLINEQQSDAIFFYWGFSKQQSL